MGLRSLALGGAPESRSAGFKPALGASEAPTRFRGTRCGGTGRKKLGREAKAEDASGGRGESGGSSGSERVQKKRNGVGGGDRIHLENARKSG